MRSLVASLTFATGMAEQPSHAWKSGKFKTMVPFGDSYTDGGRV
jgi:hypothetical protein